MHFIFNISLATGLILLNFPLALAAGEPWYVGSFTGECKDVQNTSRILQAATTSKNNSTYSIVRTADRLTISSHGARVGNFAGGISRVDFESLANDTYRELLIAGDNPLVNTGNCMKNECKFSYHSIVDRANPEDGKNLHFEIKKNISILRSSSGIIYKVFTEKNFPSQPYLRIETECRLTRQRNSNGDRHEDDHSDGSSSAM